jgi:photosystem II stability/assembly factor-like uncharacterized protein
LKDVLAGKTRKKLMLNSLPKKSATATLVVLLLALNLPASALERSPNVKAMKTRLLHTALVQDLVRVGERIFMAGERGHIAWSDDNGMTWTQATVPTIETINALHFATRELGWAVGYDGLILNTTDGGKTWNIQLDGLAYNITHAREEIARLETQRSGLEEEVDAAQAALDEAIENGAEDVVDLEIALEDATYALEDLEFLIRDSNRVFDENAPWPYMDVWFRDLNHGYVVGAFNQFMVTSDGGKTWENKSYLLDNDDGFHLNAVVGQGPIMYVVGEGGLFLRSMDEGETWERLESPDYGSFFALDVKPTSEPLVHNLILLGLRGAVYKSSDSGDTWSKVETKLTQNMNAFWVDDDGTILMVGNDGAMLYSKDGGRKYKAIVRDNRLTMGSVVVAPNGNFLFGGAGGIQIVSPDS